MCSQSKGEKMINKLLLESNTTYEMQKTFNGCKDKAQLRFNFYIFFERKPPNL